MNNALELVEELSKLIKDAIYDMERLSRENDELIAENKRLKEMVIALQLEQIQYLTTAIQSEIYLLKNAQ